MNISKRTNPQQIVSTPIIELIEPVHEVVEPVMEEAPIQELQIVPEPEKDVKTPRRRRRPRKKAKPSEDVQELQVVAEESLLANVAPKEDSNPSEDVPELRPDSISLSVNTGDQPLVQENTADVANAIVADAVVEEKMSSGSSEPETDLLPQKEKERPLLKKSRPRKKATLQDYLPFS